MHFLLATLLSALTGGAFAASAYAAGPARKFSPVQYPPSLFQVSQRIIAHGAVQVRIVQARKIKSNKQAPHLCRAWLSVSTADKVLFERYFDDIDAAGDSFGLFVPRVQPGWRFVAVVKIGDYDGRLYLIRDDGKTTDLDGGFYFVTEDGRFLFSEYHSDSKGATVFDLESDRTVFAVRDDRDIIQWYSTKDRQLFFTGRLGTDWPPRERLDIVYRYDFGNHRFVQEPGSQYPVAAARKLAWAFDPRKHQNCR